MSPSRRQDDIDAEAANWVIRLGGEPLRAEEQSRLDEWLTASPAHRTAFARAQRLWDALGQVAAQAPPAWQNPPCSHRMLRIAAALVIVLGGAGIAGFWYGNPAVMLAADYRTAPGESRNVTLSDGSVVELDTASALAVRFNNGERRVELLTGTAYFTVAPMQGAETRPFIVAAANGTAKALGTQFMVRRQDNGAEVMVAEHKVRVAVSGPQPAEAVLSPGQEVHYDTMRGLGPVAQVDIGMASSWRQGRLVFDNVPLADVVAALNRYRRGRIVITNPNLAGRRVSGVFETADLTGALSSITRELGVHTVSVPPFVTLLY